MSNVSLVNGHIDYDEMTPQKALEMLNDVEFSEKYQGKQEYTDMLLFCKEALEKQIPKKVNISISGTTGWNTKCHCPNCRSYISRGKYCNECGQALNWSGTE